MQHRQIEWTIWQLSMYMKISQDRIHWYIKIWQKFIDRKSHSNFSSVQVICSSNDKVIISFYQNIKQDTLEHHILCDTKVIILSFEVEHISFREILKIFRHSCIYAVSVIRMVYLHANNITTT